MKRKAWMCTSKLEMMTALLMRYSQYDDAVAIVPFSLVNAIGKGYEAFKKTLNQQYKDSYLEDRKRQLDALFLEKYNVSMYSVLSPVNNQYNALRDEAHSFALQFREETETILPTLIEDNKFKAKEEEIMTPWTRHTDFVFKKILSVNPCLIQEKVIEFPQNLNDARWMVTFVFNPSSIDKDTEYRPGLQTCFFRFCSMKTTESRSAKNSKGLLWFLNLAYCHAHCRVVLNRERVV
jgi:hypothetical protein